MTQHIPPAISAGKKISVFGAAGHTGRFVVAELSRRGWRPVLCGRDIGKLEAIAREHPEAEVRLASVENPVSLDRACFGVSLIINCAGPFIDTAAPVVEAALRNGIHYLDVAAEQAVALAAFERFNDAATRAGVVILPSMAFYGGLSDLLATAAMRDWDTADEIAIATALDGWQPTRGSRSTAERNPGPRFVVSGGQHELLPDPRPTRTWRFSTRSGTPEFGTQDMVAFPLSEIVTISRHLKAPEVHAFLNRKPWDDIHDPDTPTPVPADESGKSAQTFLMEAMIRKGDETRHAAAWGRDIYAVTAPLLAEAVERILDGRCRSIGTMSAGEAFDAVDFLRALSPRHLSFEIVAQQS